MNTIRLDFDGPYSFLDKHNSVFDCRHSKSAGVYLWTIRQREDRSHLIHYIGETDSFAWRHRDHFVQVLGLNYGVFDLSDAQKGKSTLIWRGLWRDRSPSAPREATAAYLRIRETVVQYLRGINIFFAPLSGGSTLRKHAEGCIGQHIRSKQSELKALYPDDNKVGPIKASEAMQFMTSAPEVINGLDTRFMCKKLPNKLL